MPRRPPARRPTRPGPSTKPRGPGHAGRVLVAAACVVTVAVFGIGLWHATGLTALDRAREAEAEKDWRKALDAYRMVNRSPSARGRTWLGEARAALALDLAGQAEAALVRATEADPADPEPWRTPRRHPPYRGPYDRGPARRLVGVRGRPPRGATIDPPRIDPGVAPARRPPRRPARRPLPRPPRPLGGGRPVGRKCPHRAASPPRRRAPPRRYGPRRVDRRPDIDPRPRPRPGRRARSPGHRPRRARRARPGPGGAEGLARIRARRPLRAPGRPLGPRPRPRPRARSPPSSAPWPSFPRTGRPAPGWRGPITPRIARPTPPARPPGSPHCASCSIPRPSSLGSPPTSPGSTTRRPARTLSISVPAQGSIAWPMPGDARGLCRAEGSGLAATRGRGARAPPRRPEPSAAQNASALTTSLPARVPSDM